MPSTTNPPAPATSSNTTTSMLFDIRQYLTEDSEIFDIPAGILQTPPPKPHEFLYLQHYFSSSSGVQKDLKACESPEEAIDLMADELASLRLLLRGYLHNLSRYGDKFDTKVAEVQKDLEGFKSSYNSLSRIVRDLWRRATKTEETLNLVGEKVSKLKTHAGSLRPPKIVLSKRGLAQKNPPMSRDDEATIQMRSVVHQASEANKHCVAHAQGRLRQRQLHAEIARPPSLSEDQARVPSEQEKTKNKDHSKGKQKAAEGWRALDPRVSIKMEKLAAGVDAMRSALQHAHGQTEREINHMRTAHAQQHRHTEELEGIHNAVQGRAVRTGTMVSRMHLATSRYDEWASASLEDQGEVPPSTSNAGSSRGEEAPSTDGHANPGTDDVAAPLASSDTTAADSTSQNPTPIAAAAAAASSSAQPDSSAAPPTSDQPSSTEAEASWTPDVYALSIDLQFDKNIEELTHEEAIRLLRALPLRVQFTPYGVPDGSMETSIDESSTSAPEVPASRAASAPANGLRGATGAASKQASSNSQSRKRGREVETDTDGASGLRPAREPRPDSRVAAGGSPVKKTRLHKEG